YQLFDRRNKASASGAHPHGPPASEQWNRMGLFDEAIRGVGKAVALKARERKRIVGIVDRAANECLGALTYESRIGAKNERDRLLSARQKRLEFRAFKRNHRTGACAFEAGLRSSHEERRQSSLDGVCDQLSGAIFGVAQRPRPRETLLLTGRVIRDRRKGSVPQNDLARAQVGEIVARRERVNVGV